MAKEFIEGHGLFWSFIRSYFPYLLMYILGYIMWQILSTILVVLILDPLIPPPPGAHIFEISTTAISIGVLISSALVAAANVFIGNKVALRYNIPKRSAVFFGVIYPAYKGLQLLAVII